MAALKQWRPGALPVLLLLLVLSLISGAPAGAEDILQKRHLASMLEGLALRMVQGKPVQLTHPKLGRMVLEPTVDSYLQHRAEAWLKPLKSRRAAIVVVEPHSGRVLALAGLKNRRLDPRVALDASAPAASLFKVVTAAAALQEAELEPASYLDFVGRPHTLYRFQLRKKSKYRPRLVTLKRSFASSNNPVFARLGIFQLGKDTLENYAESMGFGRSLSFELPLGASHLVRPETDFAVGEMASGFNRVTSMSPLHAALMVSVFINGGRFPEPFLVDRLTSAQGEEYYRGRPSLSPVLVNADTCEDMQDLFAATIKVGTARRAFRRLWRDRVLKHIELGGKTGTIRGPDRSELYEWFAGYGREPISGRSLAVAVLVVHGKIRYANPKRLARLMLREAFRPRITAHKKGRALF